jgi:hypothetical protein
MLVACPVCGRKRAFQLGVAYMQEELVEPIGVQEVFVDYFTGHISINGVMRCVGVRRINNENVVVIRLVWPEANTESAIKEARTALASPAPITSNKGPPKRVH